jgi:hypothetical protein
LGVAAAYTSRSQGKSMASLLTWINNLILLLILKSQFTFYKS